MDMIKPEIKKYGFRAQPTIQRIICGLIFFVFILLGAFNQWVSAAENAALNLGLAETIASSIESEKAGLEDLKQRLKRTKESREAFISELSVYKIQHTAFESLILQPQVRLDDLENALKQTRMAVTNIDARAREIQQNQASVNHLHQQNEKQLKINGEEQQQLKKETQLSTEPKLYLRSLGKLINIFNEKDRILKSLYSVQEDEGEQAREILDRLTVLEARLSTEVRERKKEELFKRKGFMLSIVKSGSFKEEINHLDDFFRERLKIAYWAGQMAAVEEVGEVTLASSLLLLFLIFFMLNRFRLYCLKIERATDADAHAYRYLALHLLRRSVIVLGVASYLYLYDLVLLQNFRFPFINLLLKVMMVWILYRWASDFLHFWEKRKPTWFPAWMLKRLRRLARWLRWFAVGYIVLLWFMGSGVAFLFLFRLGIVVGLAVWSIRFWKAIDAYFEKETETLQEHQFKKIVIARLLNFIVVFVGLFAELFGYGLLALYWYISWAKSLAVFMWGIIIYRLIQEWHMTSENVRKATLEPSPEGPYPWLVYQLLRMVWALCVIVALLIAWGDSQSVFKGAYAFLSHSFSIGQISLTLLSIIYAFLILFSTHILTQIGSYILREKILTGGNLERGLEDSITTITTYLLWGFGLIIALSVLGVSTTSLAVVFGALSIGIGFGLQTIFNNFISGLILLLERPIQVGDAVEVGGIWGEVRKINVRATVVQTYDNASMIIPNSEFISQQVTNWSFKDQRLRRKIKVGVAYGSDVKLVRETLLEIAANTQYVRKYPAPDVLFWDHGDSALIFMLRFWTEVDGFLSTESNIRFEITRLFKERGIEIAFPQLDVHVRST